MYRQTSRSVFATTQCVNAAGVRMRVSMCSCAFRSAVICRERLWVTLLPNTTLFLLALLILRVFILKTKQKPSFAYTDWVWMHSTLTILCGTETPNTPAIFLAFGPFSSITACSSSLFPILHNPSTQCNVSDSTGFHLISIVGTTTASPPFESSWTLRYLQAPSAHLLLCLFPVAPSQYGYCFCFLPEKQASHVHSRRAAAAPAPVQ